MICNTEETAIPVRCSKRCCWRIEASGLWLFWWSWTSRRFFLDRRWRRYDLSKRQDYSRNQRQPRHRRHDSSNVLYISQIFFYFNLTKQRKLISSPLKPWNSGLSNHEWRQSAVVSESQKYSKSHGLSEMLTRNSSCLGQKRNDFYDFRTWTKNIMMAAVRDKVHISVI